jgi:uncharacterized damage-inducible protein DinB
MTTIQQLAKHFREVYFGGNWTFANVSDTIKDVTWEQATQEIYQLNSIATLVFHINYYVKPIEKVLQGGPLEASDKFSFDVPAIQSHAEWEQLINRVLEEASEFADEIEKLQESDLSKIFSEEKYGNYFRNLLGVIEHTHYHLGQISLLKKILQQNSNSTL